MNIFDELSKYHAGNSPDGDEIFKIPFEPDTDGLIGRECPNDDCQPKYFKISNAIPDYIKDFAHTDITCPYCGEVDNMQSFHTRSQVEWIKSMIKRDMTKAVQNAIGSGLRSVPSKREEMISFKLSFRPSRLPDVRPYIEEKLKNEIICSNCDFRYAVYGISFYCPLCGKGSLVQHLETSSKIIGIMVEESEVISKKRGSRVGKQMIENALEDVVTLYEAFAKSIFRHEIRRKFQDEKATQLLKKVGSSFQRIGASEQLFQNYLNISLFSEVSVEEREFLANQFLKRHVITHNLGLVDKKYLAKAKLYEREGKELNVTGSDVKAALQIAIRIIKMIIVQLEADA